MKPFLRNSLFFLITVKLALLTNAVAAQPVPAEWKQIRAAIEKRREKFRFFSCRVETIRTAPPFLYPDAKSESPNRPNDPIVIVGNSDILVDLATSAFRDSDETPIFNDKTSVFETRQCIHVFDGTEHHSFYPNHDTVSFDRYGPSDLTRHHVKLLYPAKTAFGPLHWAFGVFSAHDYLKGQVTDLAGLGFEFEEDDDEIVAKGRIHQFAITYHFDKAKDLCVTRARYKTRSDSGTGTVYEIDYNMVEQAWIPTRWQKTWEKYGELAVNLHDFQSHSDVDKSLFRVPEDYLQPGMWVSDSEKKAKFIVAQNGDLVPRTPGAPVAPRIGWSAWYFSAALVVMAVFSMHWWRRRRQSG